MRYASSLIVILVFIVTGCAVKQPISSKSSIVIFKTPSLKFYDKGFITKYEDNIHLQIYSAGNIVLDLKIYKDEVCQSSLKCMSSKEFNEIYLDSSYKDSFLYELFLQNTVSFKDKRNNILIKVKN